MTPTGKLRVLIVEDQEDVAASIRDALTEVAGETLEIATTTGFSDAAARAHDADLLVLDLYEGISNDLGSAVWQRVWGDRPIPTVIHSAFTDFRPEDVPKNSPVVQVITKRARSEDLVASAVVSSMPFAEALRAVYDQTATVVRDVIVSTCAPVFSASTEKNRSDVLRRATQRRLAASLDDALLRGDEELMPWEFYIYPALPGSLRSADVLRGRDSSPVSADSFRVVLSPSCDLEVRPGGKRRLESVLVARCYPMSRYREIAASLQINDAKRMIQSLREAHCRGVIALPPFESVFPGAAADLKSLELISAEDIASEPEGGGSFVRVLSIDSPLREQVVWSYVQMAGRPGIPFRNFDEMASELLKK